jgi:heat shock protein HslJ
MTERWLSELRKVRTLDPPSTVLERAEQGRRLPDPGPSGPRRAIVIVVALALGIGSTTVAVVALDSRIHGSGTNARLGTGVWSVVSLPGHDPLPPGFHADARFGDRQIRGSDGCNAYGGPYTTDTNGSISLGALSMTAVGCPGLVGDIASAYDTALGKMASYTVKADSLTLFDASGRPVVRYERNAPPPLAGVTWEVFGYRDGPVDDKRAVVGLVPGSMITAIFHANGTITGSTGCGSYEARFELTSTTFLVEPPFTIPSTCASPIKRQTHDYFGALLSTTAWKFSGPAFQLLNASATVAVTFAPGPSTAPTTPTARVTDRIDVGRATSVAFGAGSIWVSVDPANSSDRAILRIDPQTDRVVATIPTSVVPGWEVGGGGLSVADGSVWVAGSDSSGGTIVRIDPSTDSVVDAIRLSEGRVADVAVDGGSAWVLITGNPGPPEVVRIDLSTDREVATIPLDGGYGRFIFAMGGSVLAAVVQPPGGPFDAGTLVRIDPATNQVAGTWGLGTYPSVASGDGSIWAATSDGLLQIDPANDRPIGSPGSMNCTGDALAVGAGGVWCFNPAGSRALIRYDPGIRETDIAMRSDQGTGGIALTTSPGSVWVVNGTQLTRVDLDKSCIRCGG